MGKRVGDRQVRRKGGDVGPVMADFVARYLKLWWERDLSLEEMASQLGVSVGTLRNLHNDPHFGAFIRAHKQREIDELTPLAVEKLRMLLESDSWQAVARGLVIWGKWSGTEVSRSIVQSLSATVDLRSFGVNDTGIADKLVELAGIARRMGISREQWCTFYDDSV